MELQLTERERDALLRLLDSDLRDLREEIYKTESQPVREALKEDETVIRTLLERLGASTAGPV